MKNTLIWTIFGIISLSLFFYFLLTPKIHYGGDIIEYYGMTESVIKHQSLNLTEEDKINLSAKLGSGYFENPEYYVEGKDGKRYAVHFFFYSLLNIPTRLFLAALNQDEVKTFRVTNLLITTLLTFVILRWFLKDNFKKIVLLMFIYLSPFAYYLIWPGPEVLNLSLILLSLFLFFSDKKPWAIILAAIASWQSLPLIFIPLGLLASYLLEAYQQKYVDKKTIYRATFLFIFVFIPNIYFYLMFGSLSGHSNLTGVGIQNITLQKFVELFLDPNIGLFFYMPVLSILGLYYFLRSIKMDKNNLIFVLILTATSILYLTNTNWNNGTAGFGPTRYSLFLLPFFIFFFIRSIKNTIVYLAALLLFIISQMWIFSFNGYLMPSLENTIQHSPYAHFLLDNYPSLYNSTPEIFVERTSHKEGGYWDTTIYKSNGKCKKAYVLIGKTDKLLEGCKFIPTQFKKQLENPYLTVTNYARKAQTTEATFYPADGICAWDFKPNSKKPFICVRSLDDVKTYIGVDDPGRFEADKDHVGVWKMKWGKPVTVTIPPGYIVNHYSFEGVYVNY